MTCLDFENRLHEFFDLRQQELPDELCTHIAHCPACREMQKRFQQLQVAVADWRVQSPTVELADVVLRRLQTEHNTTSPNLIISASRSTSDGLHSPIHRHSPLAGGFALLASALALVAAVGIGWRVASNVSFANRQALSQTQIANTPVKRLEPVSDPAPTGDRQLDVLVHDARDAYAALASQAWQQVSATNVLLPPTDTPSFFGGEGLTDGISESLSRPMAPLGKELREAVDSWLQQVFNSQDSST